MDKIYIEKLEFRAYHGVFPPSEKESGVTFKIPMIYVLLPSSNSNPLQCSFMFNPSLQHKDCFL